MGALIVGFMVFMVMAFVIATSGNRTPQGLASSGGGSGFSFGGGIGGMLQTGSPARGIVLSISSTGSRTTSGGVRYDVRNARVDVEMPGHAPYECNTNLYIPTNLVRDVLPGSTMEVRVNRSDAYTMLVVGPDVGYAPGSVKTS